MRGTVSLGAGSQKSSIGIAIRLKTGPIADLGKNLFSQKPGWGTEKEKLVFLA